MCNADIKPLQVELETSGEAALKEWDQLAQASGDVGRLTEAASEFSTSLVARWWSLADQLIAKYSDGYVNGAVGRPQNETPKPLGYPSEWLVQTDYPDGPTSYDMKL